jgi:hypothetical protein
VTTGKIAKPPRYALIRRIALSFPGAHLVDDGHGHWFNVGRKTFALYWSKGARWIFKLPHHRQDILFEVRPETFMPMKSGRMVWSYVRVENLDASELRDLLQAAWRMVAPKRAQGETP